jgi:uncharacterized damage-inducible protein DinB
MNPDLQTIRFLWQYMVYADGEVMAAARTVSDEGYRREQHISFGSVERLLNHSMLAQACWVERLHGRDVPYVDLAPPPREKFAEQWARVHQGLLLFADGQTQESLAKSIAVTTRAGKRLEITAWAAMLHVSDHATYHRGQLNSMIKLAGGKPSPVMLSMYSVKQGFGRDVSGS